MIKRLLPLLMVMALACHTTNERVIQLGNFSVPIPDNSHYRKLTSIDSEAAEIIKDSLVILVDRNYFKKKISTEREYIENNWWLADFVTTVMPLNVVYRPDTLFKYIQIEQVDIANRTAEVVYKGKKYHHKIGVAEPWLGMMSKTDTMINVIRHFIYPIHPTDSSTYKLQLLNTKNYNESMHSYESLIVTAERVKLKDTTFVFQVFNSIK